MYNSVTSSFQLLFGNYRWEQLCNYCVLYYIFSVLENLESYTSGRCLHLISVLFSEAQLLPPGQEYTSLQEQEIEKVSTPRAPHSHSFVNSTLYFYLHSSHGILVT